MRSRKASSPCTNCTPMPGSTLRWAASSGVTRWTTTAFASTGAPPGSSSTTVTTASIWGGSSVRMNTPPALMFVAYSRRNSSTLPNRTANLAAYRGVARRSIGRAGCARLRHLVRHEVGPESHRAFPAAAGAHGRGHLHGVILGQIEAHGDALAGPRRHQAAHECAVHAERSRGRLQDLGPDGESDWHDVRTAGHSLAVGHRRVNLSLGSARLSSASG